MQILLLFSGFDVKTVNSAIKLCQTLFEMKKLHILKIFFLIFLFAQQSFGQNFFNGEFDRGKSYILLAHPTVQNLKTILFLTKNRIFDVGNAEFVGVYSHNEKYDFVQSIQFVEKENLPNIHFQEITGTLETPDIYKTNGCSGQFHLIFENSSGLILFGGPDIMPEAYSEKNSYSEVTDPNRHLFELSLIFHLLGGSQTPEFTPFLDEKPNFLVTGFCLGMQTMNVATGGSLFQDIPAQIYNVNADPEIVTLPKSQLHRNYWQNISSDSLLMGINFHPIRFGNNDFFKNEVGYKKLTAPLVLSSHHQSVKQMGKGWVATALSHDGKIIEAIRHEKYRNVFAVQFHPEVPALYKNREKLKFSPDNKPKTYHEIIGKRGLDFHLKYWKYISEAFHNAMN